MKKSERQQKVLERLIIKKRINLAEIMEMLDISESTARRIFSKLEDSGKAIRVHGGLSIVGEHPNEYSFDSLMETNIEEKKRIGQVAANTIVNGDIIYIDCGTTVFALCMCIELMIRSKMLMNLKIFTNSLANVEILSKVTDVTLVGGTYRPNRKDFAGYISESVIKQLHFDKCFLGTDGIILPSTFSATDFDTARLNQLAISKSKHISVLCDSSKFGKSSLLSYANANEIDMIITDTNLDEKEIEKCKKLNIELALV